MPCTKASPSSTTTCPRPSCTRTAGCTGMTFEIVEAVYDAKGRRKLVPTGEPDAFFECDEVLVAVGQENAFPWIERDCGIAFDEWGLPKLDKDTFQSSGAQRLLRRRRGVRSQEHHHGGGPRPRGGGVDRPPAAWRGHRACAPAPMTNLMSQKMGIHEWSYDNDTSLRHALQGAVGQGRDGAGQHPGRGRAGLRRRHRLQGGAALPELRRADGVHRNRLHRVRCLRGHLPDGLHHLHRRTATEADLRRG